MSRALLLALIVALPASADSTRVSGYVKSYAVTTRDISQLQSSLRIMADYRGASTALQLHGELTPVLSSRPLPFANPTVATGRAWRLTDPPPTLHSDGKQDVFQNIDRLNVQFSFDAGDLTIGRQPITFGMARIINPTDVFLPFDVRTFNTEYRIGIDAVRFQRPFGQLGELDFGLIVGDDAKAETSAAYFQMRTNVSGQDLQFTAMRFAEQNLAGAGIQTALGDFGFWFEAAGVSGSEDYVRASTGLDYAFGDDTYGLIEYHFNGAGSDNEADYPSLVASTPYQTAGVFLLGRHYLIPAVNVQLTPLWSLGTQAIINLSDTSAFGSVTASWNATQNIYVDVGLYGFTGDDGTEYGDNPQTLFASIRYYF